MFEPTATRWTINQWMSPNETEFVTVPLYTKELLYA